MRSMTPGSVDAIITDPPYGIPSGAAFFHGGLVSDDTGDAFNATDDILGWLHAARDLLVPGGHIAFFNDRRNALAAHEALRVCGLLPWHKFYLVKANPAPTPRPTFCSAVEECIIAEKRDGKRRWYGGGAMPNRWYGAPDDADDTFTRHPAQKPLGAMRMLVRALAPPGGLVLDPFCGSGTTGCAAVQEGRRFVGVERIEGYASLAARRVGWWSLVAGAPLFSAPNEVQADLIQ